MESIFQKDREGFFLCGCGYSHVNEEMLHNHCSNKIEGYCLKGIKLGKKSRYSCICGREFDDVNVSERHANNSRCMIDAIDRFGKTCEVCDLECRSLIELEKHKKTKTHIQKESGDHVDIYCEVCKIECNGQQQMKKHLETRKHLRNFNKEETYCKLCNLQCDCPAAYKRHIYSNSHLEKETPTKLEVECKVCNVKYISQNQIKAHLESKKHKRLLVEPSIPLHCSVCNIQCQSQATIKAHLETKKHKKRCLSAV